MAGFFKKIFSFGKKEVVEERVDETAPLPPIKWDQLDALKPEADQAAPYPPLDGEGRHEVAGRGDGADAGGSHPHPRAALGPRRLTPPDAARRRRPFLPTGGHPLPSLWRPAGGVA